MTISLFLKKKFRQKRITIIRINKDWAFIAGKLFAYLAISWMFTESHNFSLLDASSFKIIIDIGVNIIQFILHFYVFEIICFVNFNYLGNVTFLQHDSGKKLNICSKRCSKKENKSLKPVISTCT